MKKLITLLIITAALFGIILLFKTNILNTETIWNWTQQGKLLLPLVMISALIDSINPCAFSVLILTIAFLFSIGKIRSNILKIGGMYIFGVFFAYVAIGLGLLQALHLFDTPHFMAKIAAGLLIALGTVNLINEFFPNFPIKLKIPAAMHQKIANLMDKVSIPTAFFLGALVGLCEFPCTGGPYMLVIGLLHDHGTFTKGLAYLLLYNIIFISPLIIILLLAGNEKILEKIQNWQNRERKSMRFVGGILMILLGIFVYLL